MQSNFKDGCDLGEKKQKNWRFNPTNNQNSPKSGVTTDFSTENKVLTFGQEVQTNIVLPTFKYCLFHYYELQTG